MNWIKTKNNQAINLDEIPVLETNELRNELIYHCYDDKRIIGFFGNKEKNGIKLYTILANDTDAEILVSSTQYKERKSYPSITKVIPSFYIFEREFYEEFGIEPTGHPWLKPVRYSKDRFNQSQTIENYPFFKMEGEELHEVGVGPIHAGIIEPGHFRFISKGEKIYHLEIQLGYQHRNIENLFLENNNRFKHHIAESIAGDTVIAHCIAYSNATESLLDLEISDKAELIRTIALELERVAVHIGDLGAISNDIAYLMGSSIFGATRTLVINSLLEICGSRFGKGLIRVGGVHFNIEEKLREKILKTIDKVSKDVDRTVETMLSSSTVLSRLEKTGTISKQIASKIGVVGMAARASGIAVDVRIDHPWGCYKKLDLSKIVLENGDVYARTYIRYLEIKQSIEIIKDLLCQLHLYDDNDILTKTKYSLSANSMVISIVEGWRGEIVHTSLTSHEGNLTRYKIKDPSFNNWYALALAVKNNGISDFPLCNKSFNLSYCGNDL